MTTLVTGTSSGIGRATADLLLAGGTRVIGLDRDPAPELGRTFEGISADLSDPAAIGPAIEQALAAAPDIAGLVNCAGIYPVTPMLDMDPDEWDAVLSINLRAPSC